MAKEIIKAVMSGVILAFMFFIWNDFFYRTDNLAGAWQFSATIDSTTYRPFEGMRLYWRVILVQEGDVLTGTGEKISEFTAAGGEFEYEPKDRTRIDIVGTIRYKFFSPNEVQLHYKEHGAVRESSTFLELQIISENQLLGSFHSTAANSRGKAEWTRD